MTYPTITSKKIIRFFAPYMASSGAWKTKGFTTRMTAAKFVAKQMILDRIFGEKQECHVLTSVDDGYSYYSRSVPSEEADRWVMIGKVFPLEQCPTAADSGAYGYGELFECPTTAKGYCGCQYKAEIERIAKEILK